MPGSDVHHVYLWQHLSLREGRLLAEPGQKVRVVGRNSTALVFRRTRVPLQETTFALNDNTYTTIHSRAIWIHFTRIACGPVGEPLVHSEVGDEHGSHQMWPWPSGNRLHAVVPVARKVQVP